MKNAFFAIAILLSAPSSLFAADDSLRIGTFQVDATPPLGSPLCNGNVKPVMEIVTPLTARGVVLLGAGEPIVLCAFDWVGIGNGSYDMFREAVAEAVGTSPERVTLHTLHQHDAPGSDFVTERLLAEHGLGRQYSNADFDAQVMQRLAAAAKSSLQRTRPVTHVGLGSGRVEQVASNRRILGPDGRVVIQRQSSGGRNPAARDAPEGTIDPLVRLITFWHQDEPLAALTYYATHPQSFYGRGSVNWDFVGIARELREQALPGVPQIHFNGAAGNVAAGKYNDGSPENRPLLAQRLANGMKLAWESQKKLPLTAGDVSWSVQPVSLPLRDSLDEATLLATVEDQSQQPRDRIRAARDLTFVRRVRDDHRIPLTCLRLGTARVLHMPGELFVEYQLAAQAMRPNEFVAMAAYGDYGPGYIGTEIAYTQGGYETGIVSRVAPAVHRVLTEAMTQLLDVSKPEGFSRTDAGPHTFAPDVRINPDSVTYDSHPSAAIAPDGTTWAAWHAYQGGRDRVMLRWLKADGTLGPTHVISDEGPVHGPPTVVIDDQSIWVVWSTQTNSGWRVLARNLRGEALNPTVTVSQSDGDAIAPTAIRLADAELMVAWSEYRDGRFQIRSRRLRAGSWQAAQSISSGQTDAFRPVLAADHNGNAWILWDRCDGERYNIAGRQLLPALAPIEQVSPPNQHCLTPTALATDRGLYVAWLRKEDVIGGPGVISQWHTLQAAIRHDDGWKLITDAGGNPAAAELTQGLVAKIQPRPIATGGYLGQRTAPMLMQQGNDVWLLWERKSDHSGSTSDVVGDLLGRPIRHGHWREPVLLYTGLVDYHLAHVSGWSAGHVDVGGRPSSALQFERSPTDPPAVRRQDGQFVMIASQLPRQTRRIYHRLVVDTNRTKPFKQDQWTGWRPIDLPVQSELPERQQIRVGDKTYQLYWADLHCHSALTSDAEGEQDELTHYARKRAMLDVVVFTNNDFIYDVPLTQHEYALGNFFADVFTRPGEFLSLPGFEWTSRIPGVATASLSDPDNWTKPYLNRSYPNHRSVIFPPRGGPVIRYPEVANDISVLNEAVAKAGGITLTQHDAFQPSGHSVEVGMELTSGWRNYIARVPELFHQPLNDGARLGFVANGDSHRRAPGLSGALTAIYCEQLTAESILEALRQRRCFATNGSRILIDARANGALMGQEVVAADRRVDLTLHVIGTRPVESAVLIRDGEEIMTFQGQGKTDWKLHFRDTDVPPGRHWYYWRVTQQRHAPELPGNLMVAHGHLAWSTPHWIEAR